MATNTGTSGAASAPDPSNLRTQVTEAFARTDDTAAERVQHLQWVHQARASQLARAAIELKAAFGADDPRVKDAEAALSAAKAASTNLAVAHQQMTTPEPDVAPDGWALHGRVFTTDRKPVRGVTVFLVDAVKARQDAYGFAYTDDTGYFLLKYGGGGEASTSRAAKDTRVTDLFVAVDDINGRHVPLESIPFKPVKGAAVYQNIVLSQLTQPTEEAPPRARKAARPKGTRKT
jgi:hypothetical protein